jgi:RES domain-containing protein
MTLQECEAEFERIESASSAAAIRDSLRKLLKVYPSIDFSFGRGSIYWRAQHASSDGFPSERRMWYPPANMTRAGRINDVGTPCLYLSAKPETALGEIGVKVGDYVHLAGFRILADRLLKVHAVGELSHVQKIGYVKITGVDPGKTLARMLNGLPHEEGLRLLYIDSFLGSVLSDVNAKDTGYLTTRILADLLWRRSRAGGLIYPSVRSPLGINLAVAAKSADTSLHSVASAVIRITKVLRFGYIDFDIVRTATGVDSLGQYQWQVPEHPKHMLIYHLSQQEFEQGQGSRRPLLDLPTHQALPPDNPGFLRRLFRRLGQ